MLPSSRESLSCRLGDLSWRSWPSLCAQCWGHLRHKHLETIRPDWRPFLCHGLTANLLKCVLIFLLDLTLLTRHLFDLAISVSGAAHSLCQNLNPITSESLPWQCLVEEDIFHNGPCSVTSNKNTSTSSSSHGEFSLTSSFLIQSSSTAWVGENIYMGYIHSFVSFKSRRKEPSPQVGSDGCHKAYAWGVGSHWSWVYPRKMWHSSHLETPRRRQCFSPEFRFVFPIPMLREMRAKNPFPLLLPWSQAPFFSKIIFLPDWAVCLVDLGPPCVLGNTSGTSLLKICSLVLTPVHCGVCHYLCQIHTQAMLTAITSSTSVWKPFKRNLGRWSAWWFWKENNACNQRIDFLKIAWIGVTASAWSFQNEAHPNSIPFKFMLILGEKLNLRRRRF